MTEPEAESLLQTLSEKYGVILVARWAAAAAKQREKRLLKQTSDSRAARDRRKAATGALASLTEADLTALRQRMVTFPQLKK